MREGRRDVDVHGRELWGGSKVVRVCHHLGLEM